MSLFGIISVVAVTEINKSKTFTWNAHDIKLPALREDICSCLPGLHTLCIFCWHATEINFTRCQQRNQQSVTRLLRKWFQQWCLKIWTNHNSQRKKNKTISQKLMKLIICLHAMCCGVSHLHNYMLVLSLAKFRSILQGEQLLNIHLHSNTLGDNLQVNSFCYYLYNAMVGCGRTCGEICLRVLIFDGGAKPFPAVMACRGQRLYGAHYKK